MLRKRTKTIAQELGVTVDDVLGSCRRLGLSHVGSESSLLSVDEIKRVKRDLAEEQLRRQSALLRRETVVETGTGRVVEKRLNPSVMRRRHAEPQSTSPSAVQPGKPLDFEAKQALTEPQFVAPIFESSLAAELELPGLPVVEASSARKNQPAQPAPATSDGTTPSARRDSRPEHKQPQPDTPVRRDRNPAPASPANWPVGRVVDAAPRSKAVVATPPIAASAGARISTAPAVQAASPSQPKRSEPQPGRQPYVPGQAINLTSAAHASAPTLDDGLRAPKVLGKIDLRKPAARPAATSTIRPAAGPRPAARVRPAVASQAPRDVVPLPVWRHYAAHRRLYGRGQQPQHQFRGYSRP